MSQIRVDTITDEAGSGAPNFPNGATGLPAPTTAQVLSAYAGAESREVGTYTVAWYADNATMLDNRSNYLAVGTNISGTLLRVSSRGTITNVNTASIRYAYESVAGEPTFATFPTTETTTLSGTWKLMTSGAYKITTGTSDEKRYFWWPHLWLRVS